MIQFINDHLTIILAFALVAAIVAFILNSFLTRRFFKRQFRKSIDSLSLPALMDEMTNNREKFRVLTDEMMDELSDRQLLEGIYYHLLAAAKGSNMRMEKMVFGMAGAKRLGCILVITQELFKMTGFIDTFTYNPVLTRNEVADSYLAVRAKHGGKVVRKATELYLSSKDTPSAPVRAQLRSYDDAFRWYDKIEKMDALIAAYVRAHRAEFVAG